MPIRTMRRFLRMAAALGLPFVALTFLCQQAPMPPPKPAMDDPLDGYEVVRCLFQEGRLVVRHEGKLFVLREGDLLPGSRISVASIRADQAVLVQKGGDTTPGGEAGAETMILITTGSGGQVHIRYVRNRPSTADRRLPLPPPGNSTGKAEQRSSAQGK